MEIYKVDLAGVTGIAQLHDRLAEALPLPEWYGRNLDALNDALSEMQGEILIQGIEEADDDMTDYLDRFQAVCIDADRDNPLLRIMFR